MVVNHPRAIVINEEIQKKVTEYEHILIAMQVNKDDMTIAQFKTYLRWQPPKFYGVAKGAYQQPSTS